MKYQVEIRETLTRVVGVHASNEEEALAIVRERYNNEEIVLGGDDYSHNELSIVKGEKE